MVALNFIKELSKTKKNESENEPSQREGFFI